MRRIPAAIKSLLHSNPKETLKHHGRNLPVVELNDLAAANLDILEALIRHQPRKVLDQNLAPAAKEFPLLVLGNLGGRIARKHPRLFSRIISQYPLSGLKHAGQYLSRKQLLKYLDQPGGYNYLSTMHGNPGIKIPTPTFRKKIREGETKFREILDSEEKQEVIDITPVLEMLQTQEAWIRSHCPELAKAMDKSTARHI